MAENFFCHIKCPRDQWCQTTLLQIKIAEELKVKPFGICLLQTGLTDSLVLELAIVQRTTPVYNGLDSVGKATSSRQSGVKIVCNYMDAALRPCKQSSKTLQ